MSVKKIDRYLIAKKIGKGSFASIYKVFNIDDDKTYALKRIDTTHKSKKLKKTFIQEINVMKSMNHPHILKLYKVVHSSHHINMFVEYCDSGDLHQYLSKLNTKILPERVCSDILCQISQGLQHLREHNYIHRDLKPQNILMHSDGNGRYILKIADFGFTRELDQNNMAETICGSPLYMAPEVLHHASYDERADMWSIGVLMFQMLYGKYPIEAQNTIELVKRIKTFQLHLPHQQFSPECINLVTGLLVKDPEHRMGFDEFYNHPFLSTPSHISAPIAIAPAAHTSFVDDMGLSCSPFSPPIHAYSPQTKSLISDVNRPFSFKLTNMSMPTSSRSLLSRALSSKRLKTADSRQPLVSPIPLVPVPVPVTGSPIAVVPPVGATVENDTMFSFDDEVSFTPHIRPVPKMASIQITESNVDFMDSLIRRIDTQTQSKIPHDMLQTMSPPRMSMLNPAILGSVSRQSFTNQANPFGTSLNSYVEEKTYERNFGSSIFRDFVDYIIVDNIFNRSVNKKEKKILGRMNYMCKQAGTVTNIAEMHLNATRYIEASALYVKAMDILHFVFTMSRKMLNEKSLSMTTSYKKFSEGINKQFGACIEKNEYIKKCMTSEMKERKIPKKMAERILYDCAMRIGREGGVCEQVKDNKSAMDKYNRAVMLLRILMIDKSLDTQDKKTLENYVVHLEKRLS